jgi:fused signal recognition particle receptor
LKSSEDKKGLFQRLQKGLSKTRSSIAGRMDQLFLGRREMGDDALEDMEEILFTSDMGVVTTQELIESIRQGMVKKELDDPLKLKAALKAQMLSYLEMERPKYPIQRQGDPRVVMVIGVNGVGKTTTIGKAAHQLKAEGNKVMLVAADTFRAAAVEQLAIWGERVGAEVIRQDPGADPSAVVFDALFAAISRNMDVVLIDTAGRLHTKKNLMDELKKIQRVANKKIEGAPHEIWLVLDATTGQNAVSQAQMFHEALGVTDIVLTKLDGTAKGGIVVGICHQLKIPIRYIGIGEKLDDLRPFNAAEFVEAILD